jgi:hypothetical protein
MWKLPPFGELVTGELTIFRFKSSANAELADARTSAEEIRAGLTNTPLIILTSLKGEMAG